MTLAVWREKQTAIASFMRIIFFYDMKMTDQRIAGISPSGGHLFLIFGERIIFKQVN